MDKEKKKFPFIEKLKSIKHIEVIIIVIFVAILLIIYFSTFKSSSSQTTTKTSNYTTEEYANYLEEKLSTVLCHIKDAGKVNVMITLECGIEYIYATNTEETTTSSTTGQTTTTKIEKNQDVIMVSVSGKSSPIVLKENLPKVNGVIVVASGAKDIGVRLELQKAVKALLEISEDKIEILIGN